MAESKQIQYLNKDFDGFKQKLLEFDFIVSLVVNVVFIPVGPSNGTDTPIPVLGLISKTSIFLTI